MKVLSVQGSAVDSPFMTVKELAVYLRPGKPMSIQTLYRWAASGRIPARYHNGSLVFHRSDVDSWSASSQAAKRSSSPTTFEQARMRVRSLKTEHTVKRLPRIQKGQEDGN